MVETHAGSSQVKMAFVKKEKKEGFCPSLNLAVENVEGTLNEYLNDVRAIYEQDRKNHWRKLGKVRTAAGEAQLTEIDTMSTLGSVRMLQLILLKEGRAYILTAAAQKNEFSTYYRDFQEAFHSLTLTQDLLEAIPQFERRTALKQEIDELILHRNNLYPKDLKNQEFGKEASQNSCLEQATVVLHKSASEDKNFEIESAESKTDSSSCLDIAQSEENFEKNQWPAFQKKILSDFEDMGSFWQVLLLNELSLK